MQTFRNSKIIYYGPHSCDNCGVLIAKMGREWGGNAFTYPSGPIYPNTEWHPHVCDPKDVAEAIKPKPATPPDSLPDRSDVKLMVDRFLTWRLPENFNPDGGITFKSYPLNQPTGTNLLDATQAEKMIRYLLDGVE